MLTIKDFPNAMAEYNLWIEALKLISAICIKYKVASLGSFSYRQDNLEKNCKLIDFEEINRDVFTLETLWLSTSV